MKKYFLLFALAAAAVSCKKENQPADPVVIAGDSEVVAPAMVSQEDLVKEAKSKPLTNLALSENHHDFGKIKKGEKVAHTYTVTNMGSNPLIISQVKPGCGCTAPEYTTEPIMPGKTGKITLSFDSTNFDGLVNKQAEVYANVEKAPITITFSANIQP